MDQLTEPEVDDRSLLELLMDEMPIKREVKIDGWPRSVWIWKLELAEILDLNRKRGMLADERGTQEWGVELLVACLGDANAPGTFRNATGRSWLRRQAEAVTMLIPLAAEFNELTGPHPDRKKKSKTAIEPEPSSPSANELA